MRILYRLKSLLKINPYWIILFLCGFNLLVMHYYFYYEGFVDHFAVSDSPAKVDNCLSVAIDVSVIYLLAYLCTWKHQKATLTITFFVTLIWSFSNILYSRFFCQYISLSAIGQGGALMDKDMIRCVIDGLRWGDLYYILCGCFFCFLIRNCKTVHRPVRIILLSLLTMIGIDICSYIAFAIKTPKCRNADFILRRIEQRQFLYGQRSSDPNNFVFFKGSIRSILYELVLDDLKGTIELTPEQHTVISSEIINTKNSISNQQHISYENIIFIIVESYMSFASNLKVNGQEITPFLNSLRCDSSVYYNGMMKQNVTIGESSDGQFIYMTGILPLRSIITVSKAKDVRLQGLPKIIGKGKESRMIIPTLTLQCH